jgi:hypothetical protein
MPPRGAATSAKLLPGAPTARQQGQEPVLPVSVSARVGGHWHERCGQERTVPAPPRWPPGIAALQEIASALAEIFSRKGSVHSSIQIYTPYAGKLAYGASSTSEFKRPPRDHCLTRWQPLVSHVVGQARCWRSPFPTFGRIHSYSRGV